MNNKVLQNELAKGQGHVCHDVQAVSCDIFHQRGTGKGTRVLLIGESPAASGWHEGYACRTKKGTLLATGRRLNELLESFDLSADTCGFTELSKCYITDRKNLLQCSLKCWPLFLALLEKEQYKLLIILGVHTTALTEKLTGISLQMGELASITIHNQAYTILPIYHPSPINPQGRSKNKEIFKRKKLAIAEIVQ